MSLLKPSDCFKKFGNPSDRKNEGEYMVLWNVPTELEIGVIPKRLYCNHLMVVPLEKAFGALIRSGMVKELKTWDGCFNIRFQRGALAQSLHSWGLAIDVNAAWNGLGKKPVLSKEFVKCFTDNGFDWGGAWGRPDGMHFQLKRERVV
jgi:hypothetical protein